MIAEIWNPSLGIGSREVTPRLHQPPAIPNLTARFGIERCVVENEFTGVAGLEFRRPLSVVNDGQHLGAVRASLPITLEDRPRKLLIGRISRLFRCTFPRSASTGLLLFHRAIEARFVQNKSVVPAGVLDEVSRQSERVIQAKGFIAAVDWPKVWSQVPPIRQRHALCKNLFRLFWGAARMFSEEFLRPQRLKILFELL